MTAVWTAPRTWANNELVDQTIMNQHVRDNLEWLKTPPTSGKVTFASDVTIASTSFTDITGLTTTLTTAGGGLDVFLGLTIFTSSGANGCNFQLLVDGSTAYTLGYLNPFTTNDTRIFYFFNHIPALVAGSHTVKVQCKSGTGTLVIRGTTWGLGDPLFYVREGGS